VLTPQAAITRSVPAPRTSAPIRAAPVALPARQPQPTPPPTSPIVRVLERLYGLLRRWR
jgi:hypothetical protein